MSKLKSNASEDWIALDIIIGIIIRYLPTNINGINSIRNGDKK